LENGSVTTVTIGTADVTVNTIHRADIRRLWRTFTEVGWNVLSKLI
jgi:hypothetical protein